MTLLLLLLLWLGFDTEPESASSAVERSAPALAPQLLSHGPFLGAMGERTGWVWMRTTRPAEVRVRYEVAGRPMLSDSVRSTEESDLCVAVELRDLEPATSTSYTVLVDGEPQGTHVLRSGGGPSVRLVLASCVDERRFPDAPSWERVGALGVSALVLLGDTPYIDSTELAVQRERYRALYSEPGFARIARNVPLYATWDDHDFGRNDSDGDLEGKEQARQAFGEYHALGELGRDGQGIYSRHRLGPVELFLLDARWFAGTEPSPADEARTTLLGRAQWEWLRAALIESDAPFKLLCTGMVWNGAVRPGKRDHWATYAHERDALFAFLGEAGVEGVVLVGGDVHRSRALRHDTSALVGYELTEFISSPLANLVIPAANQPHPGLLFDDGTPFSFLELEALPAGGGQHRLRARFHAGERVVYELELLSSELRAP